MANILYIDRDEQAQQALQTYFGGTHNIIAAHDGPTAIQYCAMIRPDLILIDQALPDFDEYGLGPRLKMFMPQTPILLIGDDQVEPNHTSPNPINYAGRLTRPLDPEQLRNYLRTLLSAPIESAIAVSGLADDHLRRQFESQIAALNQANKRLALLHTIGALIGASLDLEHLTDEILAQINKTIQFDSATLFLLKGDILEAAASRGLWSYRRGMNSYDRNEHNSAWWVVTHKLPLVIADVTTSTYWEPRPELDQVKSWLGVPLIYKDRVVGVLTLDKNEIGAYSEVDAHYLFTLTYQLAIAVENAQLFEEWEEQSNRLKLINEISKEINTILNIDQLLQVVGQVIYDRLHYDLVAIFAVDETQAKLSLKAIFGQDPAALAVGSYQQPLTGGTIGRAIREGTAILSNQPVQAQVSTLPGTTNIQSGLIIPVFIGNQAEVVIEVGRNQRNSLSDQDLWTLSSLAGQISSVLKNAHLYREVQRYSNQLERAVLARTQRLQAIKQISQVVSQGLELDKLLTVVGQGLLQIFSGEGSPPLQVLIGLLRGANLALHIYAGLERRLAAPAERAWPEFDYRQDMVITSLDSHGPLEQVLNQARPLLLPEFKPQESGTLLLGDHLRAGLHTVLLAPLITGGKTIGLIGLQCETGHAFDDSDLETLETLAFQVASAIEHARLIQKIKDIAIAEERTRLARDMHDGVAQNLAYLLIQVDRCLDFVEAGSKVAGLLEKTSELLAENIDELRRNIFDLRPVELEGRSLFDLLEEFVLEFGRRWGMRTNYRVRDNATKIWLSRPVAPEIESSIYRIIQETLSNIRQHANCTQLSVTLAVEAERWLTMEIQDNGCGFVVGPVGSKVAHRANRGLGLISMQERASQIGGELIINSAPGQGTSVLAKLPLAVT